MLIKAPEQKQDMANTGKEVRMRICGLNKDNHGIIVAFRGYFQVTPQNSLAPSCGRRTEEWEEEEGSRGDVLSSL